MTSLDVFNTNILPKAQAKIMLCVQRDPCRDRQRLLRRHCTLYIQEQYYFPRPLPRAVPVCSYCSGHAMYRSPPCFPPVMRHKRNFMENSVFRKSKFYIFSAQSYI